MGKQETLETIWEVPDELWERVEPIILEEDPPKVRGRKRADPRQMLTGIIFRLRRGMIILRAVELPPDTAINRTSDASVRKSRTPLATSGIRRAGGLWNGRWHGSPSTVRFWSDTTRRRPITSECYSSHVRSCGSGDNGVWPF